MGGRSQWILHLGRLSSLRVNLARKNINRLVGRDLLLESKKGLINVKPHSKPIDFNHAFLSRDGPEVSLANGISCILLVCWVKRLRKDMGSHLLEKLRWGLKAIPMTS